MNYEETIEKIKKCLSKDLLNSQWKNKSDDGITGHCYIATESLYWLLGGNKSGYIPHVLSHRTSPELLENGETHWFLKHKITGNILDPTIEQFYGEKIPYEKGKANGMMNHPIGGSKRAKIVINRVKNIWKP